MTAMTLFSGKASALLASVQDSLTDTLAGSSASTNRRIGIKGSSFHEIINGKIVRTAEERALNVVIVSAAPISRKYFEGAYVEGEVKKMTCWSSDCQTPDKAVPEDQRQAARCMECPQNIKGSGAGEGRACRFEQRIAVMLEGSLDAREIYQVNLPPTSVFGDGDGKKMPLQAYARFLKAHNTPAFSIVTEMRFDISKPTPTLIFKPVRPLEDDELRIAIEMREHPDTQRAVALTVSQMDGVSPAPAPAKPALFAKTEETPAPAAKAKAPVVEAEDDEEIAEPKKVVKKTAQPVEEKSDIADIVGDWDD